MNLESIGRGITCNDAVVRDGRGFSGADWAFAALGLPPTAGPLEVKARWRELARQRHPDHGGAAAEFARLHDAYVRAYADALTTPCPACCGSGEYAVACGGFDALKLPCAVCAGSGKKY